MSVGITNISFSIISKAELYYGAFKSEFEQKNLNNIEKISEKIPVLHFDDTAAENFGKLKAGLSIQGKLITDADIMIASIALTNNMTLVTNNHNHFRRIKELQTENWLE